MLKKAGLILGLAAAAIGLDIPPQEEPIKLKHTKYWLYKPRPLNKKQKKARAANKRAKKARKIQFRSNW